MVECPFLNWLNNEKSVENLFKQTLDQSLVVEIIQKLKHNFLSTLKVECTFWNSYNKLFNISKINSNKNFSQSYKLFLCLYFSYLTKIKNI